MDIESERPCQVDMSIKMIQSRARCRLVCSLPAYCVKLLTRQGDKAGKQIYMRSVMQYSILGNCGGKYLHHSYSDRHFELSR